MNQKDLYRIYICIALSEHPVHVLLSLPTAVDCLACETDVEIDTLLTFSSTSADYQILTSHSRLVGYDYSYWASRCSGKFFTFL